MRSRIPFWRRYARWFGPDPAADVHDELAFHLAAKIDDLVAQGWSVRDARREAERQFGNLEQIENLGVQMGLEMDRRQRRRDYWGEVRQDLRYAVRTLRKEHSFTLVTILILALGIAANTSVFSVVNAVLFRPLPFHQPERLAWLCSDRSLSAKVRATAGLSAITYTVDAFQSFQQTNRSFESLTSFNPFYGNSEYTLTGRGEPLPVVGVMVAQNFFDTLGVRMALGRNLTREECQKGARPAVLLAHAFWRQRFAADPSILGQPLVLSKQQYIVVGVLPPNFDFGSVFAPGMRVDLYTPAVMDEMRTWGNTLAVVGRLKPGVSLQQAQSEADVLFPQLKAAHKDWWIDYASTVTGLREYVSGKLRRSLMLLWFSVGMILLIVCVNLSNLQLARAAGRAKEFAVRTALGAGRARLFRQLITESLLLAAGGAACGLALASGLIFFLARQESVALPLLSTVQLDGIALAWTTVIALATAVVFGTVPGLRITRSNVQDALKSSGAGMTTGRQHERLRATLVIAEVALACVLLTGAGLLLRSFLQVLDVDLGFRPAQAAVIKIDYDDEDKADRRGAILQEIQRQILAIPGVESAGVTDMLPLGRNRSWGLRAKGRTYAKDEELGAIVRIVTPGYLTAMGMRLQSGRDFTWADTNKSQPVLIVNQAAARRMWQGDDALGQAALLGGNHEYRVVGIIANVKDHSLETAPGPEMYLPMTQAGPEGAELVVRSKLPPETLAPTVMNVLRGISPNQPASDLHPLQRIVDQSVSPRRFFVVLVAGFAALGLILASLGVYGVISYSVTRRTQEIGIRMALGASTVQVRIAVIRDALQLALAGAAVGAVASFVVARTIASLLFGTQPGDPVTFAGVMVLLCLVALIAGYLPARRASRIEPMVALRNA